ncbi:unnamed protein product [Spirodela intermedia]|uniref:Uncharacterized protein n=1 Tax=Spirodela intermedia TaxID=51605 RepID=A0A7I8J370_SPIIN|nr:unnamed protein product [Spirodela intermedia]CAA6664686.1 unnamed protein product [Spirodela intermedia]
MRVSTAIRTLMPADGAAPSRLPSVTCSILSALQTLPPPERPSGVRVKDSCALAGLVMEVISSPQCQKNPLPALQFFRWAAARFSPTAACYATVVDLLLSHQLFSAAESLLSAVAASSAWPTHHDFLAAKFIARFGDLGDIRGAIDWFQRRRGSLGRYSHGAILRVLVRANRVQLARAVFDQIVEDGRVEPDVTACTTLIRGYCKLGLLAEAEEIFQAMSCRPNLVTYNTLIDGYCRKGMMGSARSTVDLMLQREDCSPDAVTFTTLISGFSRLGEPAKARSCLEEMVRRWNLQPNLQTYNAVISGLCAAGDVKAASDMMARMRLDAIKTDVITHTCLVKGLCVAGRPDEGAEHLREIALKGKELDSMAYGPVVKEYCRVGRLGDAMGALDEMRSRNIAPHVSLFNALLAALAENGELGKAAWLLREMPRRGCRPNFLSYSFVIAGLCRRPGRMGEVEELVAALRRAGHRPDAGMYGALAMAATVFREAVAEGLAVREAAFEGLVKGICSLGGQAQARKLFDEMRTQLPKLQTGAYRRILESHLHR